MPGIRLPAARAPIEALIGVLRLARLRWLAETRSGWMLIKALLVGFGLVLAIAGARSDASASGWGVVSTDVLNLRSEPGTWAAIINQMPWGAEVAVLDGPTGDGWYYVSYGGQEGWAFGGYLTVDGYAGWSETPVGGGGSVWVATDVLNVRADATTKSAVLDVVYYGQELAVAGGDVNGFVPVSWGGMLAWVNAGYLSWDGVSGGGAAAPAAEPEPVGPEHWIDIDRSSRMVTLYVGDEAIASYPASLGWDESDYGFYATAIGTYWVYGMVAELTWTEWGQAYIKYWVAFDPERLNGFHSWSMDENGNVIPNGDGPTGGCVALEPWAAAELYNFASYGMRVEIHW